MTAYTDYEEALKRLLAERTTGDDTPWPVLAYVTYVVTTDPETMTLEDPEWITPPGQLNVLTRGLLEQARTEFTEMTAPMVSYADLFEDDDDD